MPEGVNLRDEPGDWNGVTYYGRSQLKPAPFNVPLVGSYVFLAGLSGAAMLLSSLLDLTRGRAANLPFAVAATWPCSLPPSVPPAWSPTCTRRSNSTT